MSENNGLFIGATLTKVILLILNTFGNLLVIQAIARSHRMRTASNYLVANLAVCDLLSPLLNIPVDISVGIAQNAWHYGPVVCKLIWPLGTLLTTSSALTLVAISIDRSRALRHPFVTKLTIRQSLCIIFLIHFFSLIVIIPYAMASVVIDGQCREDWTETYFTPDQYTLIVFHVQYLIPLVILAFVYGEAACYLRRCTRSLVQFEGSQEIEPAEKPKEANAVKGHRFQGKKNSQRSKSLKVRREQNTRVVKMFGVVVAVFAVFTLPNNVWWLLKDFGNFSDYKHQEIISFLCIMFTYTNCLANPIIYGTLSRDYKSHFLRFLTLGRYGKNGSDLSQRTSRLQSTIRMAKRSLREFGSESTGRKNARTMV